MKILSKTPRTEMTFSAIIGKMGTFYEALGEELGFGATAVDGELSKFATLSARVSGEKNGFDFELARPGDTPEQLRQKFMKYIDTSCYAEVERALREVVAMDLPLTPPEQSPKLAKDADPN